MSNEFKRMQFLAGIIIENNLYEEELNFSDLTKLDDIIDQELTKAQEDQPVEEIIGISTAVFILALPGMINGFFRIIKAIRDKAPSKFNLKKSGYDKDHLDFIIDFTGKIDSYLDVPFKKILTPFIKDSIKRDKVAKYLKAVVLILMSIGTDITKTKDIIEFGKQLTPDFIDIATNPTVATIITKSKQIISNLLK
jgi:hypothetical protein